MTANETQKETEVYVNYGAAIAIKTIIQLENVLQ